MANTEINLTHAGPPVWFSFSGSGTFADPFLIPGSGTATSVGLVLPALFTVSNSPVTGAGDLTAVFHTQAANTVFAGPTTGADATPAMRALVTADLPVLPRQTRLTTSPTNNTATFANLTSLSASLVTGHNYAGRLVIKCSESQAAEGVKFDFGGGSATFSSFISASRLWTGGTTVVGTEVGAAITDPINYTTITGTTFIVIEFAGVCSGTGTFIPRFAQDSHTSGTVTASANSFMSINETSN